MSIGTDAATVTDDQISPSPEESVTEDAGHSAEGTDAPSGDSPDEASPGDDPGNQSQEADSDSAGDSPEEPPGPEWLTDDIREMGSSYGLSDDDLDQFDSQGSFQRFCRLVDRHLTAGKESAEEQVEKPVEKPAPEPTNDSAEETPQPKDDDDLSLDLGKYGDYDEDTLRIVKAAKRLQEENQELRGGFLKFDSQLQAIQREREEEKYQAEISTFHDIVDAMDPELFGGDGKLSDETDGRRKDLWAAYNTVRSAAAKSAVSNGRPAKLPSMKVLVQRASLLAFGDQIIERNRKQVHRSIQEQGRKRRPAPSKGKVLPTPSSRAQHQSIREAAREIANDPEVAALFDRLTEETGDAPQ